MEQVHPSTASTASSEALAMELAELRALLTAQQAAITRQQAALAALEQRTPLARTSGEAAIGEAGDTPDETPSVVADEAAPQRSARRGATSRRDLLRGAAAGAAVAAVAAVAIGGAEQAHAAPTDTGGNFILGQANTADATTFLTSATAGIGVVEFTAISGGTGIFGLTDTGVGVSGISSSGGGTGVFGVSEGNGAGVVGQGDHGLGGMFVGALAPLALGLGGSAGAPTANTHNAGEIYLDNTATMWVCVGGGTPGVWTRLPGVANSATGGAITYLSKPIRLLDTRGGDSLAKTDSGGPIAGGSPTGPAYPLTVAGVNWQSVTVPANAVGAIGNVTVVAGGAGGGYLAIVPHGAGFSGTATLAYSPNQVVSNSFTTGLTSGQLDILIGGTATDVILDLIAVVL